jgi:hypothetical protein
MGFANNCLFLECQLHFLGVKLAMSHLRDSPILSFCYSILPRSVRNASLPRDALRYMKSLQMIDNMFTFATNFETFVLPVALIFHERFEFLELSKHFMLRFNSVYPKKVGKITIEGE